MHGDTAPWRRFLFWILLLSFLGTGTELRLLEHTEDVWQLVPLTLLAAGTVTLGAFRLRPGRRILQALQGLMALFVAAGAVGVYLHYVGNAEFELEMSPSLGGWELFRASLEGATPTLAPAAMAQLGLLGLLYAFRHPAARRSPTP